MSGEVFIWDDRLEAFPVNTNPFPGTEATQQILLFQGIIIIEKTHVFFCSMIHVRLVDLISLDILIHPCFWIALDTASRESEAASKCILSGE